ncbi:metallophosphoesterase family protein [Bacillus ndiopicus]|uniref:metallophosphoesterase family protein n=1 Tax=Bacillus ndiopicus TaxID=1347368 RepID=UPI0005AA43C3|nr:metallophosphoesterase family protein [Bacillus ndiopicus]
MKYAIFGDLHSHKKHTKRVLAHIQVVAPDAALFALGDLYECTIGKRRAVTARNIPLKEAAIMKKKFEELLTFPSVIGNQEERIALVTGSQRFLQYEEKLYIENAMLIHGHQFEWNEQFEPTFPEFHTPLVFFGHSHRAAIYIDGIRTAICYNSPIYVGDKPYIINVGAVVETLDWCLYDSEEMTVTFMQAK